MGVKKTATAENKKLRARAEAKLKKKIEKVQKEAKGDYKRVFHELSVHQIELEMQNEELRRAQKEMEDGRSIYADLYDFAPVGYFTFDKNALIIEANLTGCSILGTPRSALIKSAFHTFVDKDSQDQFYLHRQKVLKTSAGQNCEITIVRKDGLKIEVQLESIPAKDSKGKLTFCRTVITDITERKKAEETLRQNEVLKELNEVLKHYNSDLEMFAQITSHDLREPIRGITGFINLLKERYSDKLDEKAREYIKYIVDSVKRMDDLLLGLYEYANILTQGRPLAPIPTRAALREAIVKLQKSIEETGAVITSDELPEIRANGPQFIQLLTNLIDNAIKFRSDKKPKIHVGWQKQDNDFVFFVRDNGIGIDKQFHERIFLMFTRLLPRDKYSGYGTGLTISQRIIERHGGRIWVESEAGKGATFYFTIPGN